MSKLPEQYQFIDFSDYGRKMAVLIAHKLKETTVTPIHVTHLFVLSGLAAIFFILTDNFWWAAFFLILKSILDAADGELSRIRNTPSYVGRYYDSIADILLNFLFLLTIRYVTGTSYTFMLVAFVGMQLQGTLYNYYYVILRNNLDGDSTSRIFEENIPMAMTGESQKTVNSMYKVFRLLYFIFDKTIYNLDKSAVHSKPFPKWFMSVLSTYGLGFQLLIMAIFLVSGHIDWIIPFFIAYSFLIVVFILIRKLFLHSSPIKAE